MTIPPVDNKEALYDIFTGEGRGPQCQSVIHPLPIVWRTREEDRDGRRWQGSPFVACKCSAQEVFTGACCLDIRCRFFAFFIPLLYCLFWGMFFILFKGLFCTIVFIGDSVIFEGKVRGGGE
ncbi:hypothetical protein NPIL_502641 [Nephila pilipes]|uniref:Uncharacterized protein n=1 Tax=Nephila pilipes TaxID=299642 RepID=A0A8X6UCV5_NEPPI|nr:hypothetical protein NPIL_502641 [Nephila pilipes]